MHLKSWITINKEGYRWQKKIIDTAHRSFNQGEMDYLEYIPQPGICQRNPN